MYKIKASAKAPIPRIESQVSAPDVSRMKIVGLGSSAGGLAALMEFFKHMVPDSGLSFVVIQHLMAEMQSLTPVILSLTTQMMVTEGRDGELILPNHVYTIPPNGLLTIAGGRLRVTQRLESLTRVKPFDRFLNSLAIDCGDRAIAVVLSGYDGDGSEGFIAIKARGGITYAQDDSAQVNQMPHHAMETGCVDHVLDPGKIADLLSLPLIKVN